MAHGSCGKSSSEAFDHWIHSDEVVTLEEEGRSRRMKDYEIRKTMASIENRVRHIYNQGFEAGRKAERKTGRWIEKDGWDGDVYYDCSACGESWTTIEGTPWDNDMNYCPHCGAKMEGSKEDAEKL